MCGMSEITNKSQLSALYLLCGLFKQKALHMRALKTFKDDFGVVRKNGEEWLIKMSDTETHIPNVYEEVQCLFFIQHNFQA
jgi:Major Vault Protein repeat domain